MAISYFGSHKWAPRCPLGRLWCQFLAIPWAGIWARRAQNGLQPSWIPCMGTAVPILGMFCRHGASSAYNGHRVPISHRHGVNFSPSHCGHGEPILGWGHGAAHAWAPHCDHSAHRHVKLARKAPNLQQLSPNTFVCRSAMSFPSLGEWGWGWAGGRATIILQGTACCLW